MTGYFLEDLEPGLTFTTREAAVTADEIVAFARQFDPQYFHLDAEAAARSAFGGLVASGLQTLSLTFRLFFDLKIWEDAIIGSPGMRDLKFLAPLRPGDSIRSTVEFLEIRPSASKPDRGIVTTKHETVNQRGELIFSAICLHMVRTRAGTGG
jgi:acyl dehydratase